MRCYAFFVCNNGFGHLQRTLAVIKKILAEPNSKVLLYADANQMVSDPILLSFENLQFSDFKFPRKNYLVQDALDELSWEEFSLPDDFFLSADVVVADGVLELLDFCSEAVIMSNFFWYEVLEKLDSTQTKVRRVVDKQKGLLHKFSPPVLCSKLFATPEVRKKDVVLEFGLMNYFEDTVSNNHSIEKCNILFSCGLGGEESEVYLKTLRERHDLWDEFDGSIFIEPHCYKQLTDKSHNLKPADFSSKMYNSCRFAVVRPGFGTINCCLSASVLPIVFSNSRSYEMRHNTVVLETNELGKSAATPWQAMASIFSDPSISQLEVVFKSKLKQIEAGGVVQCSTFLNNF